MSKLAKLVFGLGISFLLILLAAFLFLRHLVVKSFPVTDGAVTLTGLHAPVDVFRDDYGVPHIRARDEHDLMVAAGYVHAQDRLWQMDILRRAGEGRLSEVLGRDAVDFDKLFRTMDLKTVAARMAEQLHPESRAALEDYAQGVNAFIAAHENAYPIEFDMLNYHPEPWTVQHSLLVVRLVAWELNLSWWTDPTYGEIAQRVSPEKLSEIIPSFPDSVPPTVPSALLKRNFAALRGFLEAGRSYREYFNLGVLGTGSNAWVVSGEKSMSGKPILANDPHLPMPQPSRWYEMHLSAPGWDVAGVSVAGIPFIVIGHNRRIAWGTTNAMLDDADFFIEKADSLNPKRYLFQKSSVPFEEREEKIMIGSSDSLIITCRSSRHGPIVSDIHPSTRGDTLAARYPVAIRWTGLEVSDEPYGFYRMNRAATLKDFQEGLAEITVPGQAVVYADTSGAIGYRTTGRVPIRGKGNPLLPFPGWTGESEWKGFVPPDQMPAMVNPPEGFIACSNQRIADKGFPYYLSTLWEPPSRIVRVREMLTSTEKFTAEDFKAFQQDVYSVYAREITHTLFDACDSSRLPIREVQDALHYLRNWDYRMRPSDIASTIFNVYFTRLVHNIYADEMGEDLLSNFEFFGAIPYRVTAQLLASDSSAWFDDVTTPVRETRDDIIRKSLQEAVQELTAIQGPEMKIWQWGSLHTVTFQHPFGVRHPLDRVFNVGPFPSGGGGTTVSKTEFNFHTPYAVTVGPSMRQVIDLANPLEASMVLTTGESGQPLYRHYDDQTSLWLNGGYHRVTMDWNEITGQHFEHLELRP
jgi:penicillin amidase